MSDDSEPTESATESTDVETSQDPATVTEPTDAQAVASQPQPDTYPDAIKRASLAQNLSQSARSKDDWRLAAGRWQQAIALMEAVPSSSPNFGEVAARLAEYRRNQAYAQRQAALPVPENTQTAVVGGEDDVAAGASEEGNSSDNPDAAPFGDDLGAGLDAAGDGNAAAGADDSGEDVANSASGQVHQAAIVRRSGGTPVIKVVFNGDYTVDMIVDTGASGTVLTQRVAQALGVQATGRTSVSTASAQNVEFLLGKVNSIRVEGVELNNAVVAIAGPELDIGLLGNDFFGQYDVTVKENVVEFRER